MKYINIKKIIAVMSAGFIVLNISGCQSKQTTSAKDLVVTSTENEDNENDYSQEDYSQNETTTEEVVTIENNTEEIVANEEFVSENNQNKEEEIVSYFENLESEVDHYTNQNNFENFKDKAKEIAITGIDFIFYGKEIKGVTFNELTDTTKNKIMSIVSSIDSKIDNKIPGYKDTIKDKFGQGYGYVNNQLHQGLDYVDDKLEQKYGDNYNGAKGFVNEIVGEVKEDTMDSVDMVKDAASEGWSKLKEWYEEKNDKTNK